MAITRIKNNQITDATIVASSKLVDYSITPAKMANNFTYGSDWTITGNLTVNGQTTTIDTVSTVIEDPILLLAKDQAGAPAVDIGFIGERGSSTNIAFVWDESAGEFVTVYTNDTTTNTTVTISSYASFKTLNAAVTGNLAVTGTTAFTGNITGNLSVTGNIAGGNITTPGLITATGNITGGNLVTSNLVQGANVAVTSLTGNRVPYVGANDYLVDTANFTFDGANGNVQGSFIVDNIKLDGSEISTVTTNSNLTVNPNGTGWVILDGLNNQITGNLFIEQDLTVNGNTTYINITDLNVEDPILQLGRGANNAPLSSNDGKDRGTGLWYYTTGEKEAFLGYDNSLGKLIAATDVSIANEVVTVNTYGTFVAGNIEAATNLQVTGTLTTPNITANAGLSITTGSNGNITLDPNGTGVIILPDETANRVLYTAANKELETNSNLTFDGANLQLTGKAIFDNVVVDGTDISSNLTRLNINSGLSDIDFGVSGTAANIFYIDAGTNTASFGNATQTTNALVTFNSANSIKIPVGNTAQRPATGVTGMLRFNTTLDTLEFYDADSWVSAGTVFTVIASQTFNGDGTTVAFTLSSDQTTASCIVSINGVVQLPSTAYSVSGTTLTFTEAPLSGDVIEVRQITTTVTVKGISNTPGNAVIELSDTSNDISITGDLIPVGNLVYDLGNTTNRWKDLYLSGSSLTLGNVVMKNVPGGNSIAFYGPDGTTPATVAGSSIDATSIANGTSSVTVIASGGNIRANVGGSTVGLFYSGGLSVPGIINSGANGVGNIGSSTGYFNTIFAKATSAQYADLAEMYEADEQIPPATVVVFGGTKEVTRSQVDNDTKVAGVVSTNPSYLMNSAQDGEFVVPVALTGRVPCKVNGPVAKGDLMVATANGHAMANNNARAGTIIGKALEDFVGETGIIEVVVGRF